MNQPVFDDPMQQVLYDMARPERCTDYDPQCVNDRLRVGGTLARGSMDSTPEEWTCLRRTIGALAKDAGKDCGRLLGALDDARAVADRSYPSSYHRRKACQKAIGAVMDAYEAWAPDKLTGIAVEEAAAGAIERTAVRMLQERQRS